MQGRKEPGRDGQVGIPYSRLPGRQVYMVRALLGKGVLEAEAQLQPNSASGPGQEQPWVSWRGPRWPYLAERMMTRASSSRASISRAVTFLVPGSNCSTFSACGVSRSISRWPGQGTQRLRGESWAAASRNTEAAQLGLPGLHLPPVLSTCLPGSWPGLASFVLSSACSLSYTAFCSQHLSPLPLLSSLH